MTTTTEKPFRHQAFEIGMREVVTYDGVAIDELPRDKLLTLVCSLLRDLRKKSNVTNIGDRNHG